MTLSLALLSALALFASHEPTHAPAQVAPAEMPAQLADKGKARGVLRYAVVDPAAKAIPCRLTFVPSAGDDLDLFPNIGARPEQLAVRRNVVYTLSGSGAFTVPVGTYTVYASRGIEWSMAAELLTFEPGKEITWQPVLRRAVSTPGWVSGDFHLHTLVYSGHGDSNLNERIISLVGEGVELAVATDHNHHTDYAPTVSKLGAHEELQTVVGNEISAPIGHLNAFPLDPERPVADPNSNDANALFKFLRSEPNAAGVVPVIQLNHPRWLGIDYFTICGLDPVTGVSQSPNYSANFDTIEVLNSNPGWGYHDADTTDLEVGGGIHSVLQDWYNLLNRGQRCFAVGNSDSHTVRKMTAGYPRNFVASSANTPDQIEISEIAESLRAGRVFTTTGPFVEFRVNGAEMGETITLDSNRFMVFVRVRAPNWILLNRVKFIINGDIWRTVEIEPFVLESGKITWPILQEVFEIHGDAWVHVIVEGDEPLEPLVTPQDRPILPLAICNPIWLNTQETAEWTSPWGAALIESGKLPQLRGLRPSAAALLCQAAVERRRPQAALLCMSALTSNERRVQLAGLRGAETLRGSAFAPAIEALLRGASDPFLALAAARALAVCSPEENGARLLALFERFGRDRLVRYPRELDHLLTGTPCRDWSVIGSFDGGSGAILFEGEFGPLSDPRAAGPHPGKAGSIEWREATAREDGFLDLVTPDPRMSSRSVSYARTWIRTEKSREALYAIGTEDGGRLWVNGAELYADSSQHDASPLQHIATLTLQAGWNEILIGVQNGGGPTGLYFRVLAEDLEFAAQRP
ncbi:MAG: CehA/McbA family metallohydrolase [bacterium]|nr:hypothetical protein [Planctomycetota bacterium]HIL52965.1 hypothetical protein [Planctomycetota bacterium]